MATTTIRSVRDRSRPVGNANARWPRNAWYQLTVAKPTTDAMGLRVHQTTGRKNANPTPIMSGPIRFLGRRTHATSPAPMNEAPTAVYTIADKIVGFIRYELRKGP